MLPLAKGITEIHCHCGNRTSSGLGRETPPTDKSHKSCCILCRCDEHLRHQYRTTDEFPGCGPFCIFHHNDVRAERIKVAERRVDSHGRVSMNTSVLEVIAKELEADNAV